MPLTGFRWNPKALRRSDFQKVSEQNRRRYEANGGNTLPVLCRLHAPVETAKIADETFNSWDGTLQFRNEFLIYGKGEPDHATVAQPWVDDVAERVSSIHSPES